MQPESKAAATISGTAAEPNGSQLCLECGLCCQGILHDRVRIRPELGDLEAAERLGLPVETWEGVPTFALPCSFHSPQGCTTYPDRPTTCQLYRCKLLDRYLAKEVDLEQALSVVAKVKAIIRTLRGHLGEELSGPILRKRLREIMAAVAPHAREPNASPEPLLDSATFFMLCQKHFHPGEGKRVESP